MAQAKVLCVGEGMLEMSGAPGAWALGYGGDALNTAIHLARAGLDTGFFSALGMDPFSVHLREAWQAEGLDCSLVLAHPERACGLYGVALDATGERSFVYWRSESAARQMFALAESDAALAQAGEADLLYFSLISLAILPEEGRKALLALARAVRARGGLVAFDGNYRPRLWPSRDEAARVRDRAVACADIGLPSIDDECALSGPATSAEVSARWRRLGCGETVVKLGKDGCLLPDGECLSATRGLDIIDTSGAGDAFNAGYLARRLDGASVRDSAAAGHRLAGWVATRHGALPAAETDIYAARH